MGPHREEGTESESARPHLRLGRPGARIFGMVHLAPLPGSPQWSGSRQAVRDQARRDAEALLEGGVDGFLIENFGDRPYHPGPVPPAVIAEMTGIAKDLVTLAGAGRPVGVNVLRNDASAALAIAGATGARFIRVNVHTGVAFTDQGVIAGRADQTLRLRRELGLAGIAILADVAVKHALMPEGFRLDQAAADAVERGLADALVVTGVATGGAARLEDVEVVRAAVSGVAVVVGSGVSAATVAACLEAADAVIVGTALKEGGDVRAAVSVGRVRQLVAAASAV